MQADEQGNVIHMTEEQEQAVRDARRKRIHQRDYRERGAALYAIAMVMMRHGVSAVEAQSNDNDRRRLDEMILLSQRSGDLTLDESTTIGLLSTPIEVLLEDFNVDIPDRELDQSDHDAIAQAMVKLKLI